MRCIVTERPGGASFIYGTYAHIPQSYSEACPFVQSLRKSSVHLCLKYNGLISGTPYRLALELPLKTNPKPLHGPALNAITFVSLTQAKLIQAIKLVILFYFNKMQKSSPNGPRKIK